MSNIKPNYWIPCLGVAFIWSDPHCSLNPREERILMGYHTLVVLLLTVLGLGLLIRSRLS
jgi:hypothetical protein